MDPKFQLRGVMLASVVVVLVGVAAQKALATSTELMPEDCGVVWDQYDQTCGKAWDACERRMKKLAAKRRKDIDALLGPCLRREQACKKKLMKKLSTQDQTKDILAQCEYGL